jgi:hypothetical protein
MAIENLHDLNERLHNIDQAKRHNATEFDSTSVMRRLIIELVRHVERLEQRIAALER